MNPFQAIYEFFFCPIHGILRPMNWPFIIPAISAISLGVKTYWSRFLTLLSKVVR
jgi:hypothetical protein